MSISFQNNIVALQLVMKYACLKLFIGMFFCCNTCIAQIHKASYYFGADIPVSFTDANTGIGAGVSGGYHYLLGSRLGLGAEFFAHRLTGGGLSRNTFKDPDNSGIRFTSTYSGVSLFVDYKMQLGAKKKIGVVPRLGFGGMLFSTSGQFFDSQIAVDLYNEWGREYFTPIFENGVVVDSKMQSSGFATILVPSVKLTYDVNYWLSIYASAGYFFTNTDKLDGFFIPVAGNKGNDVIQRSQVGLSYKIRR